MQHALGQQIVEQARARFMVLLWLRPLFWKKSVQEFNKQGPILREIQRGMIDLCSRVGDLARKREQSASCDRNTSERNISKKKRK